MKVVIISRGKKNKNMYVSINMYESCYAIKKIKPVHKRINGRALPRLFLPLLYIAVICTIEVEFGLLGGDSLRLRGV